MKQHEDFEDFEDFEEFKKRVIENKKDFIECNGYATHEFSTSKKNIFEKLDFLVNNNIELDNLIGTWLIFPCSQCEEYNKEKSVHVILSRCRTVDDFKRSIEHKELIKINEKLKAEKNELELVIKNNVIVDKNDFKEIVTFAVEHHLHESANDVPDSVILLSEIADKM